MDQPTFRLDPDQLQELADMIAERVALKLQQAPQPAAPETKPWLTCDQFGKAVGRSAEYVQDRCRIRAIRALPGKPYRILLEELARYRREGPLVGSKRRRG